MHVRSDSRVLAGGKRQTYLSLAHNVWEAGPMGTKRARPVIFARLGSSEELDSTTVRGMRDALDRYLQKRLAAEGQVTGEAGGGSEPSATVEGVARQVRLREPELRMLASRSCGLRAVVEPVWKGLGLRKVLTAIAEEHRLSFDLERLVLGLVLNRLDDPMSKRACNEWLQSEAWFPEARDWQVQHFYRALDVLDQHHDEITSVVERTVVGRLPKAELALLLMDTTSSYVESDFDDVERAEIAEEWAAFARGERSKPRAPEPQVVNDPPLRMRGKSKDHRPDQPQVVIGLLAGAGGRLLRHSVHPGNRNDQLVARDLLDDLHVLAPGGRPVVVLDSGTSGGPNLARFDAMEPPVDRVSAVPLRSHKHAEAVLERPGRWRQHPTQEHMRMRVVQFSAEESPSGRPELWLATRNLLETDRKVHALDKQVARVQEALSRNDRADDHGGETCRLLTQPAYKRLVRTSANGQRLLLDHAAVARERRLAGVHLLRTTLTDVDPVILRESYQQLLKVEDDFRTFKGPLKLRPMYHRSAHRIRAHVLVCVLALVVLQELEARTGRRFADIHKAVASVRASLMQQGQRTWWMRSEWSDDALAILKAVGGKPGPRTWGAEQAPAPGSRAEEASKARERSGDAGEDDVGGKAGQ